MPARRPDGGLTVRDLTFTVQGVEVLEHAATPTLVFKLQVTEADGATVQGIALQSQIQINVVRRSYDVHDHERLLDLFGEPSRWGETLRTMLWTHASAAARPFTGSCVIDLPVPCSYDMNLAAAKYFYALDEGVVPLEFLFSGTVFYESESGIQVEQIPWSTEATYRLPVRIWKELMDHYYPDMAWLCLSRDVFDRLYRYKARQGVPTWDHLIDSLLNASGEAVLR